MTIFKIFQTFFILSASLDGILILWNLDQAKNSLVPIRKMMVDPRYLQKSGVNVIRKTDVGITCLSCNALDNASIIIGTESGAIFEGSLTNHNIIHVQVIHKWKKWWAFGHSNTIWTRLGG